MEEHLVEAALYASSNGEAIVHFTVSHDHLELFKQMVAEKADKYAQRYGIKYNISFSVQKPSTDTIAANPDNTPFRNEDGSLLFRPGGHGALIENLNEIDADVVFIKNIDNVVPDRLKAETVTWKQVIAGVLVTLQKQAFNYLKVLDSGQYNHEKLEEIIRFVQRDLCCRKADIKELEDAELVIYLRKKLNRPMRVCGVVKNVGEPGGGPFLTYNQDGTVSLQILESSQIDKNNEEYMKMFTEGTHFNPVDLVCATKDYQGNAFDLPKFVDPSTGFISSKSKNGKDLKALELPGLWNGAMSDWNTVFVEVPLGTFNPVKTVNDLLRDQHQAVEGGIKHEHHHEHDEHCTCGHILGRACAPPVGGIGLVHRALNCGVDKLQRQHRRHTERDQGCFHRRQLRPVGCHKGIERRTQMKAEIAFLPYGGAYAVVGIDKAPRKAGQLLKFHRWYRKPCAAGRAG